MRVQQLENNIDDIEDYIESIRENAPSHLLNQLILINELVKLKKADFIFLKNDSIREF